MTKKEEIVEEAVDDLQKQIKDISKKISGLSGETSDMLNMGKETVIEQVKAHPGKAITIAAAIGFVLGFCLKK